MQFLHLNEAADWCRTHGAMIGEDGWALLADPALTQSAKILFAPGGPLGLEPRVMAACIRALGPWDECLLWITESGVWPSGEDWPAFYALRGARAELASVDHKPGPLFGPVDAEDLRAFTLITLSNGWDAHLLPVYRGRLDRRLRLSHDGWVDLQTAAPEDFALAAV